MSPTLSDVLIRLCSVADVPEDEGLGVDVSDRRIAVWRVRDEIFATGDVCSHGEASLSADGTIDGIEIICAIHMGSFDVRTGAALSAPCHLPIPTYPVTIADGDVFIAAPE